MTLLNPTENKNTSRSYGRTEITLLFLKLRRWTAGQDERSILIGPSHEICPMHFSFSYFIAVPLRHCDASRSTCWKPHPVCGDSSSSNCIDSWGHWEFLWGRGCTTRYSHSAFYHTSVWAEAQSINLRKSLSSKVRALPPRGELDSEPRSCPAWEPSLAPCSKHGAQPEVVAGFWASAKLVGGGPLKWQEV